jgi:hypothetical protein
MKQVLRLLLIILGLFFFNVATAQEKKVVYTCVMHPKVQMDKPGNCPVCGMELVKKTITVNKSKAPVPKRPAASSKTHSHQENDSTVIVHDEQHNEVKDSVHSGHMSMKNDTMPGHQHQVADTSLPQHQHHMDNAHDDPMDHNEHTNMSHAYSLNLSMNRNGSGTGWLPDASPMYGYMFHTPKWMYMLHGNFFLRYNNQDFSNKGTRGDSKIDAPDWLMFMGQRLVGKNGLLHFNVMTSFDAPLGGSNGYPLLFQSGEAYKGSSIVDRQHPHDLFSELSVSYSQALSKKSDVFLYLAYPGEPALGPVAFMHRPSAMDNPDAPISHHWVDATHVTFGVATVGVRYGQFKLEGSSFTGREPNENRYDFDKPRFDSWSGRLSYSPSENWALQASHGFIKSPELLHPGEDVRRTTASAIYSKALPNGSSLNAAAVWGMNKIKDHNGENAVLVEGEWRFNKLSLHSRYEWVQKGIEELSLDEDVFGHDAVFPVNAFTAGFNYDLLNLGQTRLAIGSQATYYSADKRLDPLYGKHPMAVEVYLRIYPGMMGMKMKN